MVFFPAQDGETRDRDASEIGRKGETWFPRFELERRSAKKKRKVGVTDFFDSLRHRSRHFHAKGPLAFLAFKRSERSSRRYHGGTSTFTRGEFALIAVDGVADPV